MSASQFRTDYSLNRDASSELSLSLSSDSSEHQAASPRDTSNNSGFQWPSGPVSTGIAVPDYRVQQTIDSSNTHAVDRLSLAGDAANTNTATDVVHPGLDKPRLSTQVTAAMDGLEDQRRQELARHSQSTLPENSESGLGHLERYVSSNVDKTVVSDNASATPASISFPSILPGILQNTVLLPLSLIHALLPKQLLSANNHEGLSASTMQVPMTSVNALLEACNAIEWIAKASLNLEADGSARSISHQAQATQQNDPEASMAHFDIFELVQKLADVVSGAAASRSIDLVLDLRPSLHGQPATNQQHYRLGSCAVWAERAALNFLLMSCLSKFVHIAPVKSTILVSTTLTEKDETFLSDASVPNTKLMVFTLGLQLLLPPSTIDKYSIEQALSETSFTSLLDAFGASIVAEQEKKDGGHDTSSTERASLRYAISVPVGKLPDDAIEITAQQEDVHHYGPSPQQLSTFISTLSRKQVALYATSISPFAQKLDAMLTGFGCNVSPVHLDSPSTAPSTISTRSTRTAVALSGGRPSLVSYDSDFQARSLAAREPPAADDTAETKAAAADIAVLDPVTGVPVAFTNSADSNSSSSMPSKDASKPARSRSNRAVPFSFVIIDDDIATLQRELLRIRSAVPLLKSVLASSITSEPVLSPTGRPSRPPLAHRTKSSPSVEKVQASHPEARQSSDAEGSASVTQTIIFFTSMKSYRAVRDTVQPIIDSASFRGNASPPEIMVLPKPAGIRRILTALYATEHRSVVQLPFQPIATSPLSPLETHRKSWWAPQNSRMQDDDGFMTLTRNTAPSEETDAETAPSTPWSPIDSGLMTQSTTPYQAPSSAVLPSASSVAKVTSPRSVGQRSHKSHGRSTGAQTELASEGSTVGEPLESSTKIGGIKSGSAEDPSTALGVDAEEASVTSKSAMSTTASQTGVSAEALEYFSETAAKIGGSAASGMVIQSPDGRPAGIFFQPMASMSSTSLAGSKPSLSRGVSTNSIRRGSATGPLERHDSSAASVMSGSGESTGRDRRHTHRSTSSTHSTRTFSQLSNTARDSAPIGGGEKDGTQSKAVQGLASNTPIAYPSGSMFAPQVAVQSVLGGSRPPTATPLNTNSGQNTTTLSSPRARGSSHDSSKVPTQSRDEQTASSNTAPADTDRGKPVNGKKSGPMSNSATPSSTTGKRKSSSKSVDQAASASVTKSGDGPKPPAVGSTSKPATQFPAPAASPSDPKSKPSAVPQSGFMIGMGFASSAQRGRGPRKAPVREAVLPPIKVLIVEDNPINQRILSMFMGKKKIQYDVANNGREAVDKWKTGGYHLILMDIQLPVMDGISATKEIRKLERNANIGILPNTPPATSDSHVAGEKGEQATSPPKGDSASANTLMHQGLMKYPVGGSLSVPSSNKANPALPNSTSSRGALINGVGRDNERLIKKAANSTGSGINPFRASVIIVALTASVLSSDRVEALAAGCNDFLNKPVSLPWLNQKILEWGSMMYLMYSGLSSDDLSQNSASGGSLTSAGAQAGRIDGNSANKAQLHLGFGYGPAEKAKALANNLHLGDVLKKQKKKDGGGGGATASSTSPTTTPPAPPSAATSGTAPASKAAPNTTFTTPPPSASVSPPAHAQTPATTTTTTTTTTSSKKS